MITVYRGSCLELFDKDVKVLEMDFTADEFVWSFATNKSIVITKNSDECFYENLSISFLCDRSNINIPPSQVGFLQGFILTTFDILVKIFPSLGYTMENAKNNVNEWQNLTDKKRKRGWTPEKKEKDNNEENKIKSE